MKSNTVFTKRISQLQQQLKTGNVLLVSHPHDVFYFSGIISMTPWEMEAVIIISKNSIDILHSHFTQYASIVGVTYTACYLPKKLATHVASLLKDLKATTIFFDSGHISSATYLALKTELSVDLKQIDKSIIWKQRITKDTDEIKLLTKAAQITSKTMSSALKFLRVGVTEKEVVTHITTKMIELGGTALSFPPIVAFGPHSASPHHLPTDTTLMNNTPVMIDVGISYNNYCGDMTRTIWYGDTPSTEFKNIEKIIRDAYKIGSRVLAKKKKTAQDLDQAVRDSIRKAGFADTFIHTSGHGLGVTIHEPPSLNSSNSQSLEKNMVLTLEPGIYLEGSFGYRYENTLLLKQNSFENLSKN